MTCTALLHEFILIGMAGLSSNVQHMLQWHASTIGFPLGHCVAIAPLPPPHFLNPSFIPEYYMHLIESTEDKVGMEEVGMVVTSIETLLQSSIQQTKCTAKPTHTDTNNTVTIPLTHPIFC